MSENALHSWMFRQSQILSWKTLLNNMSKRYLLQLARNWASRFKSQRRLSALAQLHSVRRSHRAALTSLKTWTSLKIKWHLNSTMWGKAIAMHRLMRLRQYFPLLCGRCGQLRQMRVAVATSSSSLTAINRKKGAIMSEERSGASRRGAMRSLFLRRGLAALSALRTMASEVRSIGEVADRRSMQRCLRRICDRISLRTQLSNLVHFCRLRGPLLVWVRLALVRTAMQTSGERGHLRYMVRICERSLLRWRSWASDHADRRRRRILRNLLRPSRTIRRIFQKWRLSVQLLKALKSFQRRVRSSRRYLLTERAFCLWRRVVLWRASAAKRLRLRIGFVAFLRRMRRRIDCYDLLTIAGKAAQERSEESLSLGWRRRIKSRAVRKWKLSCQAALEKSASVLSLVQGRLLGRALRAWMSLLRSKMDRMRSLNLRLLCRQFFVRWRRASCRAQSSNNEAVQSQQLQMIKMRAVARRAEVPVASRAFPSRTEGTEDLLLKGSRQSRARADQSAISRYDPAASDFSRGSYTRQYLRKKFNS